MSLFKRSEPVMGFDLSDISIKVMHFKKGGSKGSYEVLGFVDHALPKGIMVNDVIMEPDLLAQHVAEVIKKPDFGKINAKKIVASIPESKAFVRVIQLPKMNEDQAELAVPLESEQYIPIPLDQAYLDWQIISVGDEKMDVLVTASPKSYIDSYLEALKKADLRPIAFEVESAAVLRALLSADKKDKDVLILDMDTYRTSLIVASKGNLEFTSSVPIAGDAFTQSIARALGISEADAEKMKRQNGLGETPENNSARVALVPVVDNLINEIKNTIRFHEEHSAGKVSEIILAGGTSKLKNLLEYIQSQFAAENPEMQIYLGNPWVNVLDPKKTPSVSDSLSYTTAIGLAIRAANTRN